MLPHLASKLYAPISELAINQTQFVFERNAAAACGPDDCVAVIDLYTLKVTGHILTGGEPDGMAWVVRH